eukprot:TRINITY_DN4086_c0_g1_i1.p1 TRINITY_DN4086_c0_g1~~TRINITY_DN4086_c0_g1_i1.p1  ORF type:complete len:271 (-),score=33.45 TRINITY_DN4086_c0_g1_i1:31-843(-)
MKDVIAELNRLGESNLPTINGSTALPVIYHAADGLLQQASVALKSKDYERSYVYYMKFTSFVLKVIPTHPSYMNDSNADLRTSYRAKCGRVLKDLEWLQQEILMRDRHGFVPPLSLMQPTLYPTPSAPPSDFGAPPPYSLEDVRPPSTPYPHSAPSAPQATPPQPQKQKVIAAQPQVYQPQPPAVAPPQTYNTRPNYPQQPYMPQPSPYQAYPAQQSPYYQQQYQMRVTTSIPKTQPTLFGTYPGGSAYPRQSCGSCCTCSECTSCHRRY